MAGVALVDGEVFEGRAGQDRVDVEQFPRVWGRFEVGSGVSVLILISETVSHPRWASAGIDLARCIMPTERAAAISVSCVLAERCGNTGHDAVRPLGGIGLRSIGLRMVTPVSVSD